MWSEALEQWKLRILSRQADAQAREVDSRGAVDAANANMLNVRAGLLPAQTSADIATQQAQARQANSAADLAAPLANASIAMHRAQAGLTGAQTDIAQQSLAPLSPAALSLYGHAFGSLQGYRAPTAPAPGSGVSFGSSLGATNGSGVSFGRPSSVFDMDTPKLPRAYAKGTARVPGKGSSKKDTVPAHLAPNEAVLNAAAADEMGRGLIAALNARGAQKMGLV